MKNRCEECVHYNQCTSSHDSINLILCEDFEDFDFYNTITGVSSDGDYYWLEMSYNHIYFENCWDCEETDWEKFLWEEE